MSRFETLLAIDTSTRSLRLGLAFGGDRLVKSENVMEHSHARLLTKFVDELMNSAGLTPDDLQALVVCFGPGSFTGLRIGLAAAKGMAVARNIPLVGVNLFELSAYRLGVDHDKVLLLMPYRRDELIYCEMRRGCWRGEEIATVSADQVHELMAGQEVRLIGLEPESLPQNVDLDSTVEILSYDAADMIHLGMQKLEQGDIGDIESLEPMYSQKSQAEIRFNERRKDK